VQTGTDLAVFKPLSLARLRASMRVMAHGCCSFTHRVVEQVRQLQQRMRSAYTPSAHNMPARVPDAGDVQRA